MDAEIKKYNERHEAGHKDVCDLLASEIDHCLSGAESKIWHAHAAWFLDGNPTVGYSRQKPGIRLMFWSGADFNEAGLTILVKKCKDASVFFNDVLDVNKTAVHHLNLAACEGGLEAALVDKLGTACDVCRAFVAINKETVQWPNSMKRFNQNR